jgi:hypothetical protein
MHYYWPALSLILIIVFSILLTLLWLRKPQSASENSSNNQRQNLAELYNRIHNYRNDNPKKEAQTTPTTHNNASTDSTYHHAIKLLQRGMDTKTLVEYCNLTQGEAELLQAVYGNALP